MNKQRLMIVLAALAVALASGFAAASSAMARPAQQEPSESKSAAQNAVPEFAPGSVLVKFKDSVNSANQASLLGSLGASVVEQLPFAGINVLSVASGSELVAIDALRKSGQVEYAEPNYIRRAFAEPSDPYYGPYQWGMRAINAPAAWDLPQGPGALVGVIDTGLDYNHPDLAGRAAPGSGRNVNLRTFTCGNPVSPQDNNGHGSHVAGVIGAGTNNGVGIAGIAWTSTILPFKALNKEGLTCSSDWMYGLDWLLDNGARVVNMSFGGPSPSAAEQEAINEAWSRGALLVVSAGNSGHDNASECGQQDQWNYPAAYNNVLTVGAFGNDLLRSYYSSCGPFVDISAPGGNARAYADPDPNHFIISTVYLEHETSFPAPGYDKYIGTSMAAPHVAGAAALLLAHNPNLTNADLERILLATATDAGPAGFDQEFGAGLLNVAAAVNALQPNPTATTVPTQTSIPTQTPVPATPTIGPGCLFSDVCQPDYFFAAVDFLLDRGAVSGYGDNTFRPFSSATRGQVTKILVVGMGWEINTSGGPHFSDVPANNPFYDFVETAYLRGVISGYSDGTFRWGNEITRGQLAKVIVEAQDWTIDTSGGPHFSDVPSTNTFYTFIETAYNHGAISGYSDGTFRWANSATRGQIAKIIYEAIGAE